MKALFIIVTVLITYGSLYPFDFQAMPVAAWQQFLASWRHHVYRGDVLGNIVLFIPFGYFGGLLNMRRHRLMLLALLFAVVLQLLQLYLPSRDANLTDILWNLLGTVIGILIVRAPLLQIHWHGERRNSSTNFLLWLLAAWFCYRLTPFVPSLDWQQMKDSLKPLLLHPQISWQGLLHDGIAWATVSCLWGRVGHSRQALRWLLLSIAATFLLEVLVVDNVLSAGNIIGALLGVSLWQWLLRRQMAGTTILALLLAAELLLAGLMPLQWRTHPAVFHWLPFYGFLNGAMMLNIASLFEKIFFYGSLLWLLQQEGASVRVDLFFTLLLTGVIETAQIWLAGHTPEITDPLLVLLLALIMQLAGAAALLPLHRKHAQQRTAA